VSGRIANSWSLVKASAEVLRLDKELLVFPLLSGLATLLVVASFVAPLAVTGGWEIFAEGEATYLGYALGFLFYLVQYTVVFFFNTALVGAALVRLDGGDPTVTDGLSLAMDHLGPILGYAALAATVGMVLRFISERVGILGRLGVGLIGMAWGVATFLAVPVLVTRRVGPIDAVKESAALLKQTWGEQVVGSLGMGWAFFLMGLSWTCVSIGLVAGAGAIAPAALVPAIGIALAGYIALALVSSALRGVYTAALYRYATTGEAAYFDAASLGGAFRSK
jgi:hypothetical protein